MFNKQSLCEEVFASGEVKNKASAERVVDNVILSIRNAVVKEGKVSLAGFGIFTKKAVKGRMGRNPKTGESVKVAPHNKVRFAPAKSFKEFIN